MKEQAINTHSPLTYRNYLTLAQIDIRSVNLGLDYRVHMDESIELLDEDEFEPNIVQFGYSRHLIGKARTVCHEVMEYFDKRRFPFNHPQQIELYQSISRGAAIRESPLPLSKIRSDKDPDPCQCRPSRTPFAGS